MEVPTKKERIEVFLKEAAVADASHDFQGSRAGENIFSKIFNGGYKGIGTPIQQDTILDEWDIVNSIINFFEPGVNKIEKFREIFLKETIENGKVKPTVIKSFQRWSEDTVPYTIRSLKVATKKNGIYNWTQTSQELFDFLSNKQSNLYFTIDACNVPFYDCLEKDDGDGSRTATCVYTREAINDAAGKKEFTNKPGKMVVFDSIYDKADYNILYPSTNIENAEMLSEQEYFFSVYNIILSGVKPNNSLTMSITNKEMTRQVQVTKHDKEDAHPNAVPTLSKKIKALMSKLSPIHNKNPNEKMEYHSYLQQKRAGDWLQCLACTNPARFNLSMDTRIKMVTLDKICMAYALFCGLDAIFTYHSTDGSYWLITFFKDSKELTKEEILLDQLNSFSAPNTLQNFDNASEKLDYDTYYTLYINKWNEYESILKNNAMSTIRELQDEYARLTSGKRFKAEDLQKIIKNLLSTLMSLCAYRSITVKLDGAVPHTSVYDGAALKYTTIESIKDNYEEIKSQFEKYKNDYNVIKKALLARRTLKDISNAELQIDKYFETVLSNNYQGSTSDAMRGQLVDKLQIFGTLFSRANGGVNGVGIFEFLNNTLNNTEKREVRDLLNSFTNVIPIEKTREQYQTFITTISFTMDIEVNDPVNITNAEVIDAIVGGDMTRVPEVSDEEALMAGPAGTTMITEELEETPQETSTSVPIEVISNISTRRINISKKQQPARAFEVTDFGPALKVIQGRANAQKSIWDNFKLTGKRRRMNGGSSEGGGEVKGLPSSFHNPLTTLFFLLRELSFRISYEEEEDDKKVYMYYIEMIANIIKYENEFIMKTLQNIQDESLVPIIRYYYYKGFEFYFMEKVQYDNYTRAFHYLLEDISNTIKKGYYKINNINKDIYLLSDDFKNYILSKPLTVSEPLDSINIALQIMNIIPKMINALEEQLNGVINDETYNMVLNLQRGSTNAYSRKRMRPYVAEAYGGGRKSRKNKVKKILKKRFRKTRRN